MRLPRGTLKSGFWRVPKSDPPLIALGVLTGIVLDHLLDLFLSNFFVFCEKSGFTGSSPILADL